ncbi:MAG: hypothetical protein F6K26_48065 [Moorea sp. SIO2I5]|nr:hypothetical protein [Moorena sp. SIO2I5]
MPVQGSLSGGQDAHSTAIHSFPDSRLPIPDSRFPKITKPCNEITLQGFMIFYLVAGGGFEPPTFGLCVPTTTFVAWIFQFVVWTVPSPSP